MNRFLLAIILILSISAAGAERLLLPDLPVVDQSGRQIAFRSEAIGEHLAVISAIYTSCESACPMTIAILEALQKRLGEKLGTEVRILTLTLDPDRDTPSRLANSASKAGSHQGWLWLTGDKQNLDRIFHAMGAYSADFAEHPPFILVGDGRTGSWKRLFGFPSPDEILKTLDNLSNSGEDNG